MVVGAAVVVVVVVVVVATMKHGNTQMPAEPVGAQLRAAVLVAQKRLGSQSASLLHPSGLLHQFAVW